MMHNFFQFVKPFILTSDENRNFNFFSSNFSFLSLLTKQLLFEIAQGKTCNHVQTIVLLCEFVLKVCYSPTFVCFHYFVDLCAGCTFLSEKQLANDAQCLFNPIHCIISFREIHVGPIWSFAVFETKTGQK
jgi:hypothetical protein